MSGPDVVLTAALAPVRDALLAAARADADGDLARADRKARDTVTAGTARAERILREARQAGIAEADAVIAADRGRAHREARTLQLRARREAYERLRRAARDAVADLRGEPAFPDVRRRLVAAVRKALGPDARIVDCPDGGIVGTVAGRRLDLSLTGFADRAVDGRAEP